MNDNNKSSIQTTYFIEGCIEVTNILVCFGKNNISLIGNNNFTLTSLAEQIIDQDSSIIRDMVFYEPKQMFLLGHSSGNLSAWGPGDKGLNHLAINKISSVFF